MINLIILALGAISVLYAWWHLPTIPRKQLPRLNVKNCCKEVQNKICMLYNIHIGKQKRKDEKHDRHSNR